MARSMSILDYLALNIEKGRNLLAASHLSSPAVKILPCKPNTLTHVSYYIHTVD